MRYDWNDDARYVRVAKRKETAADVAKKLTAEGEILSPATAHGKAIANSFWGRSWCRAIEGWNDYESRLPAGRSLLKNGGVIDLNIEENLVTAKVVADRLYDVRIFFREQDEERLTELKRQIAGKLTSLIDLINGELSDEVMEKICNGEYGLFPEYGELRTSCDCLDDAVMCRHAAAALYGIAPRLDDKPELFFTLRGIRAEDFFNASDAIRQTENAVADMDMDDLSATFGIDLEE